MPYSSEKFDNHLKDIIKNSKYNNFLDVGVGAGKLGIFLNQVKSFGFYLLGVEIDKSYIKKFNLKPLYNEIINDDIIHFIDDHPDFTTDFVFIGDCIEHLKKSDGIDLLNYLLYRSKVIVIIYPDEYIQYSWQGHASESHRSAWFRDDFKNFKHQFINSGDMNLVIIKGYLSKEIPKH